jgi:hypothetical protein
VGEGGPGANLRGNIFCVIDFAHITARGRQLPLEEILLRPGDAQTVAQSLFFKDLYL